MPASVPSHILLNRHIFCEFKLLMCVFGSRDWQSGAVVLLHVFESKPESRLINTHCAGFKANPVNPGQHGFILCDNFKSLEILAIDTEDKSSKEESSGNVRPSSPCKANGFDIVHIQKGKYLLPYLRRCTEWPVSFSFGCDRIVVRARVRRC
jgi:hypothetical protein